MALCLTWWLIFVLIMSVPVHYLPFVLNAQEALEVHSFINGLVAKRTELSQLYQSHCECAPSSPLTLEELPVEPSDIRYPCHSDAALSSLPLAFRSPTPNTSAFRIGSDVSSEEDHDAGSCPFVVLDPLPVLPSFPFPSCEHVPSRDTVVVTDTSIVATWDSDEWSPPSKTQPCSSFALAPWRLRKVQSDFLASRVFDTVARRRDSRLAEAPANLLSRTRKTRRGRRKSRSTPVEKICIDCPIDHDDPALFTFGLEAPIASATEANLEAMISPIAGVANSVTAELDAPTSVTLPAAVRERILPAPSAPLSFGAACTDESNLQIKTGIDTSANAASFEAPSSLGAACTDESRLQLKPRIDTSGNSASIEAPFSIGAGCTDESSLQLKPRIDTSGNSASNEAPLSFGDACTDDSNLQIKLDEPCFGDAFHDKVIALESENANLLDAAIALDTRAVKLGWLPKSWNQRKIVECKVALARACNLNFMQRHDMVAVVSADIKSIISSVQDKTPREFLMNNVTKLHCASVSTRIVTPANSASNEAPSSSGAVCTDESNLNDCTNRTCPTFASIGALSPSSKSIDLPCFSSG